MLPLFVRPLNWPAHTASPLRRWLLVAVAAVLFVGCAVNPVPTPSKSGGNQYEGKDADASLVAGDTVSGAGDTVSGAVDAMSDAADAMSDAADALSGTADALSGAADGTPTSADASGVDSDPADSGEPDTTAVD